MAAERPKGALPSPGEKVDFSARQRRDEKDGCGTREIIFDMVQCWYLLILYLFGSLFLLKNRVAHGQPGNYYGSKPSKMGHLPSETAVS